MDRLMKFSAILLFAGLCCEAKRKFPGLITAPQVSVMTRQVQFGPVSFAGPVEGGPCREVDGEPNMRSYPGNPNWFLQCAPVAWPNYGRWVRMPCGLGTWFFEASQRCEHPGTTGVILPTRNDLTGVAGSLGTQIQSISRPVNPGMCPDGSVAVLPCDSLNLCPNRYFCSQNAGCCASQAGQCPIGSYKLATWSLCDATQPCPFGAVCHQGICCVSAANLG